MAAAAQDLTAQQLTEFRNDIAGRLRQAKFSASAEPLAQRDYFRGMAAGYAYALDQLDELLADVVTVSLVPPDEGA